MTRADTLFVNGNIATVDRDFSFVHAVAVKNGWVIDTGETAEIALGAWVRGAGMNCDGVHMGYSAWMKEDYADNPGCRGRSTFLGPGATDEEQVAEITRCVQLAHDRGW